MNLASTDQFLFHSSYCLKKCPREHSGLFHLSLERKGGKKNFNATWKYLLPTREVVVAHKADGTRVLRWIKQINLTLIVTSDNFSPCPFQYRASNQQFIVAFHIWGDLFPQQLPVGQSNVYVGLGTLSIGVRNSKHT